MKSGKSSGSCGQNENKTMYLRLKSELPAEFKPALDEVIAAWNRRGGQIVFWPPGLAPNRNAPVWTVKFAPGKTFDHAWVGVARNGTLEILLNGNYHWSTNPGGWKFWRWGKTQMDIRQVLGHELGHALGLPHNEAKGSIMNPWDAYFGKWRGVPEVDRLDR